MTRLKLVLVVVGLALFFGGVKFDQAVLRGLGIAAVAIAFILRFVKRRGADSQAKSPEEVL